MDRREFIVGSTLGAMSLSFNKLPDFMKEMKMGVVVHSYWARWNSKVVSQKYPGFQNAIELIEHCASIGAGGVQVGVKDWTTDFAKKVREKREKLGLYLEGSIGLPANADDVSRFEKEAVAAREAGAQVLRTVCLSGRRYENFHSAEEFQEFKKNSIRSLQLAEAVVKKNKIKLAVENHKDFRAKELATILRELDSEWVGCTLDYGNNLALLEEPMDVVQTLLPFLVSTHVKDMAVEEYADGFLLSEVPLGEGIVDLPKIFSMSQQQNPQATFNLEMITRDPLQIPCLTNDYWKTSENFSASDLAKILRLVKQKKTSLPRISQLSAEEKLAAEEKNILACFDYTRQKLGFK